MHEPGGRTGARRSPRELRQCRPLDRGKELEIAREYARTRSPALEERLVAANMRLVTMIAREYPRSRSDLVARSGGKSDCGAVKKRSWLAVACRTVAVRCLYLCPTSRKHQ